MPTGKKKSTAKKSNTIMAVSRPSKAEENKWRAEDDARTLMRAEEIKRDASRIKAAKAQAKKQMEELARVVKK